ncbi:MAG: hypothetical protein HFH30_01975 [Eubacterium sp.]|nr:hypothetical protein [Eubacterium sp.]MCI8919579.1 hypothetical protein [Eubacterium sp.]
MSLAVSGYVKQFYKGNTFGATATGRSGSDARKLVPADIKAIRRAVKNLGSYDYDDGEGSELMNKVQAFVNTYNNYMDSGKEMDNDQIDRYMSKLKKLTREHESELSEIGITRMSSGKLKVDKEKLQDTSRYWVGKVFSDEAEYGRQVDKIMKNTDRMFVRNNLGAPKQDPVKKTSKNDTQTAAVSNAQNMDAALAQQLAQVLEGGRFNVSV